MPRSRWSAESRNPGKSWDSLEALPAPVLTPEQIRVKRAELAAEMVELLLTDTALGKKPRAALQRISVSLGDIRRLL